MTIKEEVLKYLNCETSKKPLSQIMKEMDTTGKITQRVLIDLIVIICTYMEDYEQKRTV